MLTENNWRRSIGLKQQQTACTFQEKLPIIYKITLGYFAGSLPVSQNEKINMKPDIIK
jgi:hypothetical protein